MNRGLDYLGLDLDPEFVAATREALALAASPGRRADAEVADFSDFTSEVRFETVVLAETLEHQEDPVAFLARATTLLALGGQVL